MNESAEFLGIVQYGKPKPRHNGSDWEIECIFFTRGGPLHVLFGDGAVYTMSDVVEESLTDEEIERMYLTVKVVWMLTVPDKEITKELNR